ncbi:MAG: Xaa-Pro peptidase family protein [Clostridia bacterium]|nr:Xaa-Pro peptidase family protein [Clostridia bacterium]
MDHKAVFERRILKFREKLKEKGIDAALVSKRENYIYLSGFTGTAAVLIISQSSAVLITDFRYMEQAKSQAPAFKIIQHEGSLMLSINEVLRDLGVKRLGFEESYVTFEKYSEYKSKLVSNEILPLNGLVENIRLVKEPEEIEIIKQAVKIADDAFSHILKVIRPDVREIEIAAEIEYFMKKSGATGASFETIVASGERASLPHGVASEKKIVSGDVITLDFGAVYQNYCSDMTRTVFLGNPDEEMRKIYHIVLEARQKAAEGARKGLTGREIDSVARGIITKEGYEKNFGHGLGHGVGLEVHEEPRLSPSGNIVMQNGMVVTVEPGIYINNIGGVRIEDMVVIEDHKPQVLTSSTKELIII